ncbi:hypothetical protein N7522_009956 [Penicillium canescens]|nr:hypothetical protein N7522_009956 [Penicillium canescens]
MLPSRKRQKTAWVEGPAADSLVQAITTENSLIQAVATEQSLAAPTVGGPNILPGFWANRAKECPWPKGARIVLTAGTLLFQLVALPLKREPALKPPNRTKRDWPPTGEEFDKFTAKKKANVEALVAQAVGELREPQDACSSCKKGDGIYSGCVTIPGLSHCAVCHHSGNQGSAESAKTQQGDGDEIVLEDSLALARQKLLLYQGLVETTAGQIMCPEDALVIIRAEKEKAAKGNAGH